MTCSMHLMAMMPWIALWHCQLHALPEIGEIRVGYIPAHNPRHRVVREELGCSPKIRDDHPVGHAQDQEGRKAHGIDDHNVEDGDGMG